MEPEEYVIKTLDQRERSLSCYLDKLRVLRSFSSSFISRKMEQRRRGGKAVSEIGGARMEDGYNIQEESISRESSEDGTCLVVWRKMSTLFDRRKMIGLGLILVTVVLWVTFAQVSNYLLVSQDFDKPFFITYLQNSLLAIFLLKIGLFWVWKKFVAWMRKDSGGGVSQTDFVRVDESDTSLLAEGEADVPVYKGKLFNSIRLFYPFTRPISTSDCSFTCIHICTNIYGIGILQVG